MNDVITVKGFGGMALFTMSLICCSRAGHSVQLNDTAGKLLIDAEDICNRNPTLVDRTPGVSYMDGGVVA